LFIVEVASRCFELLVVTRHHCDMVHLIRPVVRGIRDGKNEPIETKTYVFPHLAPIQCLMIDPMIC
jgi:hypothetical protein